MSDATYIFLPPPSFLPRQEHLRLINFDYSFLNISQQFSFYYFLIIRNYIIERERGIGPLLCDIALIRDKAAALLMKRRRRDVCVNYQVVFRVYTYS